MRQQAVLIENCLKDTIDRHIKLTAFDDLLGNSILGENSKCAYPVYKEGFRYIWNRKQGKEIKDCSYNNILFLGFKWFRSE